MKYQQSKFRHQSKKKDTVMSMDLYVCTCICILCSYATEEENREVYIKQEVARTFNNEFSNRHSVLLILKSPLLKSHFNE